MFVRMMGAAIIGNYCRIINDRSSIYSENCMIGGRECGSMMIVIVWTNIDTFPLRSLTLAIMTTAEMATTEELCMSTELEMLAENLLCLYFPETISNFLVVIGWDSPFVGLSHRSCKSGQSCTAYSAALHVE